MRVKARIQKRDGYALSRIPRVGIEPRWCRNYRKSVRRVLVVMVWRIHTNSLRCLKRSSRADRANRSLQLFVGGFMRTLQGRLTFAGKFTLDAFTGFGRESWSGR